MCALSKKVPFHGKNCKYHSEGSFFRTIHNGSHTLFTDNLETEWKFFVFLCNESHFIPSHDRTLRTDRLGKKPNVSKYQRNKWLISFLMSHLSKIHFLSLTRIRDFKYLFFLWLLFWRTVLSCVTFILSIQVHEDFYCSRYPLSCTNNCGALQIPREEVQWENFLPLNTSYCKRKTKKAFMV